MIGNCLFITESTLKFKDTVLHALFMPVYVYLANENVFTKKLFLFVLVALEFSVAIKL